MVRVYPMVRRCLLAFALFALPATLAAQTAGAGRGDGSEPAPGLESLRAGAIVGRVVDAATGVRLSSVQIRLLELRRTEISHADGAFRFERVPAGTYRLVAQRIGYAPMEREVRVRDGETVHVPFAMEASAIEIAGIVVTGAGSERGADRAYRPTTVMEGSELRRALGTSVAATVSGEPGIAQRYNGPAAAQPVIRGLSGDRVLMLEDGARTGDVASTAADHAVTIDPLTAARIEVVRGPAGLLYGSNALGGVINVIREEVPRSVPHKVTGLVRAQGESMNQGVTAGASVYGGVGPVAWRAELSGRTAGDTRTPLGMLPNTSLTGHSVGAGLSWVGDGGFVGASGRDFNLRYGVPGTFNGDTIPGAHAGGADIELRRSNLRVEGAVLPSVGPFSTVEVDAGYVRFVQEEFERGGVVGTRFGQLMGTGNVLARHEHEAGRLQVEGAIGAWIMARDFAAGGTSPGSHPARQWALAGFGYEELSRGRYRLQVGGRWDWTRIDPDDLDSGLEGIRTREFGALSGSVAAIAELAPGWRVGATVSRAFRAPSIEELYSAGPHLADFSFNIGNPELQAETGVGADVFLRVSRRRLHGELTAFRNSIRNFIHHIPTGRLDPRLQRFPVYEAHGDDAVLDGLEGKLQWEALPGLVAEAHGSHVRGRYADGAPLVAMPPAQGRLGLRYDAGAWFVNGEVEGAASQERVGAREAPTPGHALFNAGAGVRWMGLGRLHSVTLQALNVTDEPWRDHLSRVRAVAPQPGRNLRILYHVDF
jgi:iron complex outermembrane recepter protein